MSMPNELDVNQNLPFMSRTELAMNFASGLSMSNLSAEGMHGQNRWHTVDTGLSDRESASRARHTSVSVDTELPTPKRVHFWRFHLCCVTQPRRKLLPEGLRQRTRGCWSCLNDLFRDACGTKKQALHKFHRYKHVHARWCPVKKLG